MTASVAQDRARVAWALDLGPLRQAEPSVPEVVPVVAGDLVLVSDSWRVHALDAASGAPRWTSATPEGWESLPAEQKGPLQRAGNFQRLRIAPAAEAGVVVAALQLPFSRSADDQWQGIPIERALPERRLFAFDRASGQPLWNHAPAPGQDVAAGTFAQRMRVCGAPLVVGARVLVPCTYDESSIDLFVLCCALDTGQELWHAFVQRGQIERSPWGLQVDEFVAAPLAADPAGMRVLVQTGLGQLASLSLLDGTVFWSTVIPSIPLLKVKSYTPQRRKLVWRPTPAVVDGSIVFATAGDSDALVALDLESGVILWTAPAAELQAVLGSEEHALDHLVGVRDGLLVLAGRGCALALSLAADGWHAPRLAWAFTGDAGPAGSARARLVGERLLVPGTAGVHELDADTGAEICRHATPPVLGLDASGAFALTETALVPLGR